MTIDIISLFPDMFVGPFGASIIKRALDNQKVEIRIHQLREYATDKHSSVDDTPYGGGSGMVLKVDVLDSALSAVKEKGDKEGLVNPLTILLTPQGQVLKQSVADNLAHQSWLILICGHYEGFDERIRSLVDQQLSIGDYVLTGGELPAMVIVDAITRLLPGVLGKDDSSTEESHKNGLLEYPHYTRPDEYKGMGVPPILKSGDHAKIAKWRAEQSENRTKQLRPDLLKD